MEPALPTFQPLEGITKLLRRTKPVRVDLAGPWGSAKTLAAVQAAQALDAPLLIIAPGRIEAEAIHDDLVTFAGEEQSALLPAWEVLPTDSMSPADDIIAERMNTLKRLARALDRGERLHTVLPVRSLLQHVVPRKRLTGDTLTLRVGMELDLDGLLEKLVKLGYRRDVMVEARGEMSLRGGIFDVFPISSELPYRIELFGDEIESIRRFEPETQRSMDAAEEFQILPRSEKQMLSSASEGLAAITSYVPKNTIVVLDEPLAVREEARRIEEQAGDSPYFMRWDGAERALGAFHQLAVAQVGFDATEGVQRFTLPMRSMTGWAGHLPEFWEQLKRWETDGFTVQIFCVNTGERRRLLELLEDQGYRVGQDRFDLRIGIGRLRAGFVDSTGKLAVLSERELFGRHYMRRTRRRFEAGAAITQFSDLKAGDYVVHAEHGIGRYTGLRRFQGRAGDFMGIQYQGGDTIFVPVTHIDHVQKYAGGEGAIPKVDKIGGATWARKKDRVKKAVRDMTEELVKLYAARESTPGHAFARDTPWQVEFEDAFEYDETPDQARAIAEMKRDMEAPRPMDRLICGDVGYGKTEVALRGAFKAVMDGKQVAFLAPTTVLTQQHYNTLTERMADYPIRIELLNRFRTPAQQKSAIDRLKAGEVDIIIGTHRLLSKDVGFKDLGLVIIDEEQRFGVEHKERLKHLRTHVDVLTLTATPIPRTLHLSLIGIRDMSVINTAPNDRLPIHTCIDAWDANVIREAILRELNRQGQIFYLHNRVQTIDAAAAFVQRLAPRARIAVGHGQMHKHELEEVMTRFVNQEVDVLVCTTIIGSGIDIPNANTIIIDRADTFGLAELYQIRGRVGRYKHRAFAYLLIPGDKALSEEAQLRLKALEDFSALGSGFHIALRDLEIRGAGNILGAEQSGSIAAVGYETYKDLIAEAVSEHRGEPLRRRALPPFEIAAEAYIPDEYIAAPQQKMTLYRRIAAVTSTAEVDELIAELRDRFGPAPGPVQRLLDVIRARALAAEAGVKSVKASKAAITVEFETGRSLAVGLQNGLRHAYGSALEFQWQKAPILLLNLPPNTASPLQESIRLLTMLCEE